VAAGDVARNRAEMPSETAAILDRRSLARDHRRLAAMLRPGQRVLDLCQVVEDFRAAAELDLLIDAARARLIRVERHGDAFQNIADES